MSNWDKELQAIPTNIITGFLGVGKTTAIQHLLSQKPAHEYWAILVNEFGEIGIDGSLLASANTKDGNIKISEVPGGCICCTAGLSMQIALNRLLEVRNPDRLLIEPTGLGHPKEILEVLTTAQYQSLIKLQKVITLVDARCLQKSHIIENETFKQQITIADIVIGNKMDLCEPFDKESLHAFVKQHNKNKINIIFTQNGEIPIEVLDGPSAMSDFPQYSIDSPKEATHANTNTINEASIPDSGYLCAENQGEGYKSIGWRFSPLIEFDKQKLFSWLCGLSIERLKGIFITDQGVFAYNLAADVLKEIELDDCLESRVEIISDSIDRQWEIDLLSCAATPITVIPH